MGQFLGRFFCSVMRRDGGNARTVHLLVIAPTKLKGTGEEAVGMLSVDAPRRTAPSTALGGPQ